MPVGDSLNTSRYMYARDINPGDKLLVADTSGSAAGTVTAKRMVLSEGLYNPYTKVRCRFMLCLVHDACCLPCNTLWRSALPHLCPMTRTHLVGVGLWRPSMLTAQLECLVVKIPAHHGST